MNRKFLICQNIRKWREFRGVKQEVLARQIGLSKSAVSQLENGRVDITLSRAEQIAHCLGIEFEQLFSNPQELLSAAHNALMDTSKP